MMGLSLVFLGGLFLDGWAHNHNQVDESFFTIWHAFFYSGYLLVAALLVGVIAVNRWRGLRWRDAVPEGYALSVLGVLIFAAGGVGDLVWHELFGIEEDFEALFSPSHLALGAGVALIVAGPLRAAWQRSGAATWTNIVPALLSLAALLSTFTFFVMFAHPLANNVAGRYHYDFYSEIGQIAGATSILLISALWMGAFLHVLRRWRLPIGSLTVVFGLNTVAMAIVNWHHAHTLYLLLAMIAAAAIAEFVLRPDGAKTGRLRRFAFVTPVLILGVYFAVMSLAEGLGWSIHLWAGLMALSGVVGWLLSYLAVPPAIPHS
jgi:hypothetical protein